MSQQHRRGTAKGTFTIMSLAVMALLATKLTKLRPAMLKKCLQTLEKKCLYFSTTQYFFSEDQFSMWCTLHSYGITREKICTLLLWIGFCPLEESLECLKACTKDGYTHSFVKLPPLLPLFEGDRLDWASFEAAMN